MSTSAALLRQWQVLRILPRYPKKVTASEVRRKLDAEGFLIGIRTVERDLQGLSSIFPLHLDERSKPFGWSWDRDAPAFNLPSLSGSEALTLLVAKDHLAAVMPASTLQQLEPHFRQAEIRLGATSDQSALSRWRDKVRVVVPTQALIAPTIDRATLATIQDALLNEVQCRLTYRRRGADCAESYPVNPLGLVQRGQVIYLVCTIKSYGDVRLLALHRCLAAEGLDVPAQVPVGFDLDKYVTQGAFGWGQGDCIRLEAVFSSEAGSHLYETPLSTDQVIETRSDGQLRVVATVLATQQLTWWLLAFGDAVEVVSPQGLREAIVAKVKGMGAKYAT